MTADEVHTDQVLSSNQSCYHLNRIAVLAISTDWHLDTIASFEVKENFQLHFKRFQIELFSKGWQIRGFSRH